MPPKSAPPEVDKFAELDHFYRLRDPLAAYVPLRLADPLAYAPLVLAEMNLCDALRAHCNAFPVDQKNHPGLLSLLATMSYFWMKDGKKGTRPWWFCARNDLLVRYYISIFLSSELTSSFLF